MKEDLKKMMSKLKKGKEEDTQTPETPKEDPETTAEEDTQTPETPKEEEIAEAVDKEEQDYDINAEIGVLQNDGIFRRELLAVLRDLVNVHKVNTQTLLDIKKGLKLA